MHSGAEVHHLVGEAEDCGPRKDRAEADQRRDREEPLPQIEPHRRVIGARGSLEYPQRVICRYFAWMRAQ
jgi:hypothetical protein